MSNSLQGATMVRFGAFEAMVGAGKLEDGEAGKPVWKVWYSTADDVEPIKLLADVTRDVAVSVAQSCATSWRALGKPAMTEVELKKLVELLR